MALDFPKPNEVSDEYLKTLKNLKPEVDIKNETDNDWFIRAKVYGGVLSGMYADQRKVSNDAFPQNARREAVERHLDLYFDRTFTPAQPAVGNVKVDGVSGLTFPALTDLLYDPNGNTYRSQSDVVLTGPTGLVPVQSVSTGQAQNLLEGAELSIPSPPAGFGATAEVFGGPLSDGKDLESTEEAVEAILARVRAPIAGGTRSDYEQYAQEAAASVNDVNVIEYYRGLGTVGIVFTAGTTDIDTAIDNGDAIVLVPSAALVATVQSVVDAQNPLTDCLTVLAAVEEPVDVTVRVRYQSGDGSTIPTGQTLTQKELVQREVRRAIYLTPIGGRKFGSDVTGSVIASEIEEVLDLNLSTTPHTVGEKAEILVDREVDDLSATGRNRLVAPTQVPIPGTITVIEES